MATFSERHGYKESRTMIQREGLDADTRVDLWNSIAPMRDVFRSLERGYDTQWDTTEEGMLRAMWTEFLRQPRDEYRSDDAVWALIKSRVIDASWNEALDVIETVVKLTDSAKTSHTRNLPQFVTEQVNVAFERNLVGYRFIEFEVTPIDSAAEAESVATAIDDASSISGAKHHLKRSTELLSDRANPDYPNSIKEAISAVEAVVKKLTGESTLGAGLAKLDARGVSIHPALKSAWAKMYGWTSDADGIRHAGIEAAQADQALAKYLLVSCSAFVSYLIEEGRKASMI